MKSFYHQVAAITGAASGMGRALAQQLALRQCHLALADVNEAGLAATAELIAKAQEDAGLPGVRVSTHQVDVASQAAMAQYATDVVDTHGKVNLIFNNAGVSVTGRAEQLSLENFEWLMGINFWGVVHGSRAFLPYFSIDEPGHIVNTSSIFGTIAVPTQSAYNASKFAVRGFTYALRMELANSHPHVGVSCVQPGGVKTNIIKDSRYLPDDNSAPTKEEIAALFEEIAGLTPLQAADQILAGVSRNRPQILVGKDAKVIALIERLFPVGYMRLLKRFIDRAESNN